MTANEFLTDKSFEPLNYNLKVARDKNNIKVLGVGGAGSNAVNNLYNEGVEGVTFVVLNTDDQALQNSPVQKQILLYDAKDPFARLGAGGNPEKARQVAEATLPEIEEILKENTQMAFITAGMGGGTGTGAAPVIAQACHKLGVLTVGIVTLPFEFEVEEKMEQALRGVIKMLPFVDSLLIIQNAKIPERFPEAKFSQFMKYADKVLADAVKSVVEIITKYGYVNVDFADVYNTLKGGGRTVIDSGIADGDNRVQDAFEDALNSPLLYKFQIEKAEKVLIAFHTSTSNEISSPEIKEITKQIRGRLQKSAKFIWGAYFDDSLGDNLKVTILATGANEEVLPEDLTEMPEYKSVILLDNPPVLPIDDASTIINPNIVSLSDLDNDDLLSKYQNEAAYERIG
ncbi:MAG: cell division protein FtsZ [Prevotellaceae bacterium]|jgi:cell division protein FtsZ|nr:cell division protein FtsZ [Prevotellaceae bacterium]